MQTDEKLYNAIIECCYNNGQDVTLDTIVTFLTNLRGEHDTLDWLVDCKKKIKDVE